MTPSSSSCLTLANVSRVTSGYFMCLVTGGDNPFLDDYDTKHVTVAGEIAGLLARAVGVAVGRR